MHQVVIGGSMDKLSKIFCIIIIILVIALGTVTFQLLKEKEIENNNLKEIYILREEINDLHKRINQGSTYDDESNQN